MDRLSNVLECYTALVMMVILFACINERGYRDKRTRVFVEMLLLDIVILLSSSLFRYSLATVATTDNFLAPRIISCIMQISFYTLLAMFYRYAVMLVEDTAGMRVRQSRLIYPICAFYTLLWCVSGWTGAVIRITITGLQRGPLYLLGQTGGWVVAGYIVYTILRYRERLGWRDVILLLSFPLFPMLASLVRLAIPNFSYMPLALSLSLLLIYNFNFWQQRRKLQQQETRMAEERMAVMMSQIGPHFIYNVLNSIYYLCRKDPEQAQTAVGEFAEYLRANLDGVEHKRLIPAQQEFAHVRHYLNLEQMRFGEDLQVEMDLEKEDFMVPPLTLQPLVENAVKHGVMKRETGGTVRLVTRREKGRTVVRVEDNGVGFDPARIQEDGKVHIGIRNVRERLWNMCRATLEINSRIGVGTEVRIEIPDQAAEG